MSHKIEMGEEVFAIQVDTTGDIDKVTELMNEVQDSWTQEICKIANDLDISEGTARDIWYLRTRSRWTQELENQLIRADHAGNPIDSVSVCNGEWPPK